MLKEIVRRVIGGAGILAPTIVPVVATRAEVALAVEASQGERRPIVH